MALPQVLFHIAQRALQKHLCSFQLTPRSAYIAKIGNGQQGPCVFRAQLFLEDGQAPSMQCFCVLKSSLGLLQDAVVAAGLCNAELRTEIQWLPWSGANTVLQLLFAPGERFLEVRFCFCVTFCRSEEAAEVVK